jgi:hypothetical protein
MRSRKAYMGDVHLEAAGTTEMSEIRNVSSVAVVLDSHRKLPQVRIARLLMNPCL